MSVTDQKKVLFFLISQLYLRIQIRIEKKQVYATYHFKISLRLALPRNYQLLLLSLDSFTKTSKFCIFGLCQLFYFLLG